ncbi:MAG: hypothetical protein JW703_02845 [Candidatus Diapherotrites archaeon]|nr:hypothetical protein [Candidatus Diapherotrites archaeon]
MNKSSLTGIFLDAEKRLVLYYLANNNPRVTEETLAKATKISADKIREILGLLQTERLAKFESEHGYTLTPKGLTGLYNYHKTVSSL